MSQVKNYKLQGGDKTLINGTLEITPEGSLTFGGISVSPANNQALSEATTIAALKDDFNSLITKLIASGLMKDN